MPLISNQMDMPVKKALFVSLLLATSSTMAFAQAEKADPGSLSGEAKEQPSAATSGGSTATPTAKPGDSSLSDKASKDNPGTSAGGSTANPTAQPKSSDLPAGAKDDIGKK